jgi:hypothetical protein
MGVSCGKQSLHGWHCVQMRSLPVSARATNGTGGVPMARFIRYSAWPDCSLGREVEVEEVVE